MHLEMTSSTRRTVRRSVGLGCDVLSPSSGLHRETIVDLSPRGACVTSSTPIAREEGILLGFVPPGRASVVEVLARVARVREDRSEGPPRLLGLEFTYLSSAVQRELERAVRGLPPPLPRARRALDLSWIEVSMSWEEDLGDRVNAFEAEERLLWVDDGADLVEVSAPAAVRLPVHLRAR